ncbi:class I SAM-dependent methyltransferase [Novosphingobium sp. P6W]|uniref:class I SAM-dependent methyltransferase n=1 Tax=Novosphingobium sp. P6W TaxID=1609758 RepID=UPI0005C2E971|nr:class I SAM-dependent methyltransferase [Novosphingobium sp. P6W]AXB79449.1 class I SAM-dependent methyltransferase [Novosphingobium sp. P6W]KIS34212.1 SAM-dependent methlyltransferase [Novosphingobium sp. P6W]
MKTSQTPHSSAPAANDLSAAYDGPPDYRVIGRHAVFPETSHDEIERINFLAQMNRHLAARVVPGVKAAYDNRVVPGFAAQNGRPLANRHEARKAMLEDPAFQTWSALRRMTMEQRQQAGRWTALRQNERLARIAADLTDGDERLSLDPALAIPRYVSAVDHHCMPGSYHTEYFPGDVTNGANYDHAGFVTTSGLLGKYSDGGGHAVVNWVRRNLPDFKPRKILEIGGTVGHSSLPLAQAFPDAELTIADLGAPVLRYGLARAKSLGVDNVRFVQASGEDLAGFADESFDWIQTTMFLHELSTKALRNIFAETRRLLKPGGIVLHVEQPQYAAEMPLFEQAMRDWDAFYNNEPFWSRMHEMDLDAEMVAAGFDRDNLIHGGVFGVVDRELFPDAAEDETEDYGRKAAWHVIGATI